MTSRRIGSAFALPLAGAGDEGELPRQIVVPDQPGARQRRRQLLGLDAHLTPALRAAASATSRQEYWRRRLEQEVVESKTEGAQAFEFAELLAQAGETNRALDWLEEACRQPDFMTMYMKVAPNLDPLREEPRFKALLQRGCRTPSAGP